MKETLEKYASMINSRLDSLMDAYNKDNAKAQLVCAQAMR